ncbi:MAG: LD-carboxypeptidase [Flavobacteriia bacterium]|nr:LD-carboxypeptidase [Flavobacteriia bacterium]
MIAPPALRKGSLVYITAPAKAVETEEILSAQKVLEGWGFKVLIAPHCVQRFHYFSGTDAERQADFQEGLDNPEIEAILCARGGYGCARIVEKLNWDRFVRQPKWIVGFSDVTVFHHKTQKLGIQSIHGIMPLGMLNGSPEARATLNAAWMGKEYQIEGEASSLNREGEAMGELIGGNLTIITSLIGTPLSYTFENKILFIEDIGEHVYKIDRMLQTLKLCGVFEQIKGLIVGGFTDMEDTDVPFGKSIYELIHEVVKEKTYPLVFNFPAGHITDNRALVVGKRVKLSVTKELFSLVI